MKIWMRQKDASFGKKSKQGMRFQREACTSTKQSTGSKGSEGAFLGGTESEMEVFSGAGLSEGSP